MRSPAPVLKPVIWVASARRDLRNVPDEVARKFGYALYAAQRGGKDDAAKPLRGFGGAGVLEIVEDHSSGTYRAVYTVKLSERVYVLHVFQKKSKHGIATTQPDTELVKDRLKQAEEIHKAWQKQQK